MLTMGGNAIKVHFHSEIRAAKLVGADAHKALVAMYAWMVMPILETSIGTEFLIRQEMRQQQTCSAISELQNPIN